MKSQIEAAGNHLSAAAQCVRAARHRYRQDAFNATLPFIRSAIEQLVIAQQAITQHIHLSAENAAEITQAQLADALRKAGPTGSRVSNVMRDIPSMVAYPQNISRKRKWIDPSVEPYVTVNIQLLQEMVATFQITRIRNLGRNGAKLLCSILQIPYKGDDTYYCQ